MCWLDNDYENHNSTVRGGGPEGTVHQLLVGMAEFLFQVNDFVK